MPPEYRRQRRSTLVLWVIVVLAFLVIAFYVGTRFAPTPTLQPPVTATTTVPTVVQAGAEYYSNPAEWQTYTAISAGYSIAFPIDFSVSEPTSPKATTSWRTNNIDQSSGFQAFTLTVPAAFEPQTNFDNAMLTVDYSKNAKALADCLVAENGEATSSTQVINGATFTIFTSSDAGAGNLYDTASYRTIHAGSCYAVEFTIHSSQLGNFPAEYNLQQFDEGQASSLLQRIVGTFTFL
jgi:hypothetical protein